MNKIIVLLLFVFVSYSFVLAQETRPNEFQSRYHVLHPDELKNSRSMQKDFSITEPPPGPVRSIAEFERNQGVIISRSASGYFGVPLALIASLSNQVMVYVIVSDVSWNTTVSNQLQGAGVNMDNVTLINYAIDSYWSRDYSPWFIAYDEPPKVGIVDFPYNRPRPNDNNVPQNLGDYFDLEVFGMNLLHTGGNYMSDGMGVAASTTLVYTENEIQPQQVHQLAEDYLGIQTYYLVQDPMDDYIEHIDCWGKFLDVDKILIGQVPESDDRYDDYEAVADYWANQTSSYGNKFQVYRVYSPNGQPYTNSLIMNNQVYVPFIPNNQWNDEAQASYEQAMPGYEIIGVSYQYWQSTDALHCRTHEVPDFGMLYIKHYPILDTIAYLENYPISAQVISYSGSAITDGSVKLHYRVNNSNYSTVNLANTSGNEWVVDVSGLNPGDVVDYYLEASDASGRTETHPFIGVADPHRFVVEESNRANTPTAPVRFAVYPNPAKDRISLVSDYVEAGTISYAVYDIHGKIIVSGHFVHQGGWQLQQIDISEWNAGIYFFKVSNGIVTETKRFIVY